MKKLTNHSLALIAAMGVCTAAQVFAQNGAPFEYRGELDAFHVQQPSFVMRSHLDTELAFQRLIFAGGQPGRWHVHYGSSFVYVIQGQIKLEKYNEKDGFHETPVYGPGEAFTERGGEVHRAVVVSAEDAVVMVARVNVPVGAPLTVPVDPPEEDPDKALMFGSAPLEDSPFTDLGKVDLLAEELTNFTYRASLDSYLVETLPDFLMVSARPTDLVIQRSRFLPGAGPWHYHPGASFVRVLTGNIMIQKYTKSGIIDSPVRGPGDVYYESGYEVHRAVVVSQDPVWLLVVRFGVPVGAEITTVVNPFEK